MTPGPWSDKWDITQSGIGIVAIDDHLDEVFDPPLRAIRVGTTAGDIDISCRDGSRGVVPSLQIGETFMAQITMVHSDGTTAAGITGLK